MHDYQRDSVIKGPILFPTSPDHAAPSMEHVLHALGGREVAAQER